MRIPRRRFLVAAALLVSPLLILAVWVALPLPAEMLAMDRRPGLTIEDRSGIVLRSTRASDGSSSTWTPYDQVDPDLINAFVAVEDRRFWDHHGVDLSALARATRDNLRQRRIVSGASTITMQLARLLQGSDRDWAGKIVQALWAVRLDAHLDKQRIMEEYLNRVHLGQATAGVAAASALYFGRGPSELSVAQAATLAGLAHAPSRDNPHANLRAARSRRAMALSRMRVFAFITPDEAARASEEPLVPGQRVSPFLAPHFTTRVLGWLEHDDRAPTVRSSIDAGLQAAAEEEVRLAVGQLSDRGVAHAAAVVLDNATGEILAWVGSPDFWSSEDGQTDMVISPRQPGSALKPFLYGVALDRGLSAATVLPDIPKAYATATGPYAPRNYDRRFRGPVRVREALASSYNVPAVEVAARVGTANVLHTLHLAGFTSLNRSAEYYGLGLSLGNGDVTLIELANAYRALANEGAWRPWTWRAQERPATGNGRPVISKVSSAIILDILGDAAARVPGFGVITPFDFPFPVAVKTGTSRHFTDNWAVGTTRGFTVAVWAGNFSGRPMDGVSGITGAGPLLRRLVMLTAQRVQPGTLITPREAGAQAAEVCRLSGLLATSRCAAMTEWFSPGSAPKTRDTWERDAGVILPDEYASWAATSRLAAVERSVQDSGGSRSKRVGFEAGFRLLSPLDGDRYAIPPGIEGKYATIALRAAGASGIRWTVDGREHEGSRWALAPGAHLVEAQAPDGQTLRARIIVDPPR